MSGGREASGLHRRRVRRERDTPARFWRCRTARSPAVVRGEENERFQLFRLDRRGVVDKQYRTTLVERSGGARSVRRRKASRVRDRISRRPVIPARAS